MNLALTIIGSQGEHLLDVNILSGGCPISGAAPSAVRPVEEVKQCNDPKGT